MAVRLLGLAVGYLSVAVGVVLIPGFGSMIPLCL